MDFEQRPGGTQNRLLYELLSYLPWQGYGVPWSSSYSEPDSFGKVTGPSLTAGVILKKGIPPSCCLD